VRLLLDWTRKYPYLLPRFYVFYRRSCPK
jgi:hypothetical protein